MDPFLELPPIEGLDMRYTTAEDAKAMAEWFREPDILRWFPMTEPAEIEDSVDRWLSFARHKCSITATMNGKPCGIATLYLMPYRKLLHQSEFGMIVSEECRGRGIGAELMKNLMHLGKSYFNLELLHCQVYAENPAIRFYKRFGFREFGRQTHWIKDNGLYVARVMMERFL